MNSQIKLGQRRGIALAVLCVGIALLRADVGGATDAERSGCGGDEARAGSCAGAGTSRSESAGRADETAGDPAGVRTGADRKGSFPTKENLTLHLSTDLGTVKITSAASGRRRGRALHRSH